MTWPFVTDAIPILYYGGWASHRSKTTPFSSNGFVGQEQGYQGAKDPDNREACVFSTFIFSIQWLIQSALISLWLSGYVTENKTLVSLVKSLNAARKSAISLNSSFLTTPVRLCSLLWNLLADILQDDIHSSRKQPGDCHIQASSTGTVNQRWAIGHSIMECSWSVRCESSAC